MRRKRAVDPHGLTDEQICNMASMLALYEGYVLRFVPMEHVEPLSVVEKELWVAFEKEAARLRKVKL